MRRRRLAAAGDRLASAGPLPIVVVVVLVAGYLGWWSFGANQEASQGAHRPPKGKESGKAPLGRPAPLATASSQYRFLVTKANAADPVTTTRAARSMSW